MKTSMILTVDVGTSSMRAILYDNYGEIEYQKQVNYSPDYMENNLVEMDPKVFKNTLIYLVTGVVEYSGKHKIEIGALSMTSQRSSVIPLDRQGEPLYKAIMWQDKRCDSLCKELSESVDTVYKISGLPITSVFSAIKMRWFKLYEPKIYEQTYKMAGIHDYLISIMTGEFVTDRCLASRTNLLDLNELEWSDEAIGIFEIDKDKLCQLIDPGSVAGRINHEFYRITGLSEGTRIISAGGDQQCAALGVGTIEEDQIEVNIGTGGYVIANADEPVFDPERRVFCNVSAIPGKYVIEGSILTSGVMYRWMKERFFGDEADYESINEAVNKAPLGANGLIMLPYFKGRGTPNWNPDAKGVFYNVGMETTKGDFARSSLESIAFEIEDNIRLIETYTGRLSEISCCGGLTNSDLFVQMLSDVTQKKCIRYGNSEATTIGAWITAAVTLGICNTYEGAFSLATKHKESYACETLSHNVPAYQDVKNNKEAIYQSLFA